MKHTKLLAQKLIVGLLLSPVLVWGAPTAATSTNKSMAPPKVLDYPFNDGLEVLPPEYAGNDLLRSMQKLPKLDPKREFEKSEEYEVRKAKWLASPYFGLLTPTSLLAFRLSASFVKDSFDSSYDADSESYKINVRFANKSFDFEKSRWLETFYDVKSLGITSGTTRMGIRFKYSRFNESSVGLAVKEMIQDVAVSIPLPRGQAAKIKGQIAALAIGAFADPYKAFDSEYHTPSLDSPSELSVTHVGMWFDLQKIWVYNTRTGEIYIKLSAPFQKCEYEVCE